MPAQADLISESRHLVVSATDVANEVHELGSCPEHGISSLEPHAPLDVGRREYINVPVPTPATTRNIQL